MTVFQNILLPVLSRLNKTSSAFSSLLSQKEAVGEAEKILGEVWLKDEKDFPPGTLHGDQRLLELGLRWPAIPSSAFSTSLLRA